MSTDARDLLSQLRERLQETLGDAYALERELGGGGMARVFVAEEKALGRRVLVKVLAAESADRWCIDCESETIVDGRTL